MKRTLTTLAWVVVTSVVASTAFVGCATSGDRDSHKRTAGQYIDDKVLATKVRSALGDSDIYKFPDVKVNTYKGTVQLTGFVDSMEQKTKAEQIARNVEGVMNVQNNITMKGETERVRGRTDTTTQPNDTTTHPTTPSTTTPAPIK
jgi:osmotically-inducible protein OsmY